MANKKITDLTALTAVDDADLFEIVDDPAGSPTSKKITRANVLAETFTQNDGKYIATDTVRARDGDGLELQDDGGNGVFINDGGNVSFGATAPATPLGQVHIEQSTVAGAQPVLYLEQKDVSEEFIKLVGTSAADNTQSLLDTADLPVSGVIKGWYKVYIKDNAGAGDITDAVYYSPFFATPTASQTTVTAAGPTDNLDVTGLNTILIDTNSNNVTIGGLVNGIADQVLHIVIIDATNNAVLEHNEGGGNQDIYLQSAADETITTQYGGWTLVCNGTSWFESKSPNFNNIVLTGNITMPDGGTVGNGVSLNFDDSNDYLEITGGRVGVLTTTPAAQVHIDQSSTTAAIPVLTLDQGDVSEEFIRYIGTSAADNTQSLVDAADLPVKGKIVGWRKCYIQDDAGAGDITDAVYYEPFYSTPVATQTTVTAAGPTDDLNVAGLESILIDTTSNNVTIGGLVGGVAGQILHIAVVNISNNAILEHNEGGGNQDIFLNAGGDETLTTSYGGWILVCDGSNWYDTKE